MIYIPPITEIHRNIAKWRDLRTKFILGSKTKIFKYWLISTVMISIMLELRQQLILNHFYSKIPKM